MPYEYGSGDNKDCKGVDRLVGKNDMDQASLHVMKAPAILRVIEGCYCCKVHVKYRGTWKIELSTSVMIHSQSGRGERTDSNEGTQSATGAELLGTRKGIRAWWGDRRAYLPVHGLQNTSREIAVYSQEYLLHGRGFYVVACMAAVVLSVGHEKRVLGVSFAVASIGRSLPLSGSREACPMCLVNVLDCSVYELYVVQEQEVVRG